MKKVAIVQSNYIPWKGYFDLIAAVDEFILYDDVQYTRQDWRNRNLIKTCQGIQWITVPVMTKGRFPQPLRQTKIDGLYWREKHWKTLIQNYRRTPFFQEVAEVIEPLYRHFRHTYLSDFNRALITQVCRYLVINTKISNSGDYTLEKGRTDRLVDLCAQAGGSHYVSGPSAHRYLDETLFQHRSIQVMWFDYVGYPEYPQPWGTFCHNVTILDLLFNCGARAPLYMKHINEIIHRRYPLSVCAAY